MPIYEFKCLTCEEFFEILALNRHEKVPMKCPKCGSETFERVLSTTNYSLAGGSGQRSSVSTQTRTCSSGSCTTYDIPGHSRS